MRIITFTTLLVSLLRLKMSPWIGPWKNDLMFFSLGIYSHCNDFPTHRYRDREILEIDAEDPSDDGPDIASPVAVTYNATDLEIGAEDTAVTP